MGINLLGTAIAALLVGLNEASLAELLFATERRSRRSPLNRSAACRRDML